jgi:hypothetical protein
MALTTAQVQILKADIAADPTLSAKPHNGDGAFDVAAAYNLDASPAYYVWRTEVPVNDIFDAVTWANFTPADAPDGTVAWSNRSLACQGKQFNLQTMLGGRTLVDASKTNIRAGLNDATTLLPSGAGGVTRSGGWAAILPVLSRKARRIEKLFAVDDGAGIGNTTSDPRGASTNPDRMTFEGTITPADVVDAWNS